MKKISKTNVIMNENVKKLMYEAPQCQYIELEVESSILTSSGSASDFEDGGNYGRPYGFDDSSNW